MIRISASLIKSFLHKGDYREVCLRRIKATRIDKSIESPPSEAQLRGLHFEGLALGSSAGGKTFRISRKRNGEKRAVEERIDLQVMKFKQQSVHKFMSVMPGVNTQIRVYKKFNDFVMLEGEMDIFPTPLLYRDQILRTTIIDLKLTENLDSDFGEYGWARVEDMDHIQMILYPYLLKDFDIPLNQKMNPKIFENGLIRTEILPDLQDTPAFYWVWEHGSCLRNRIIKVNSDNLKLNELFESIRKVVQIIMENDADPNGWKPTPSFKECKTCPLNFQNGGLCEEANIIQEV